jgi:formylglycine-generating enzyme required for sulfatase activity
MKAKAILPPGLLAFTALIGATLSLHAQPAPPTANSPFAQTETIDLGGGVTMDFVLIPLGSFMMGSTPDVGDSDEIPQHRVTFSLPFLLGKYEVTQEQWTQIMGDNPSHFKGPKLPVDSVSWNDCQRFLEKLEAKIGRRLTLPTEAQWEFACRADTKTRWNFGDKTDEAANYAWFDKNAQGTTHPVGEKKPNAFGAYDLHGNVAEWCSDWYSPTYPKRELTDPKGPASGDARVTRGGAWGDQVSSTRSACRSANGPRGSSESIGFRCVMQLKELSP